MTRKLLGQILIDMGALDETALQKGLAHQKSKRLKVGESLIQLALVQEEQVFKGLAIQANLPYVDLRKGKIPEAVAKLVSRELAEKHRIVPLMEKGGKLVVAIDDPLRFYELDQLSFVLGRELTPAIASPTALRAKIRECYGIGSEERQVAAAAAGGSEDDSDAPIIRMVQRMVESALEERASDIHVEPFADRVRVRYRVDGVLIERASHPMHLHPSLMSRLKIMAGMDISEKRKPQDGRISIEAKGRDLDVRASILPASHGETMVMRLLDKERGLVSLAELGFDGADHQRFQSIIKRPNGIFLVTGPTGSGKTTTLYAALRELNRPDVKIITAEDPVEYQLKGINQVQVKHQIGLDFARILRAMLRQAPNVILVGEIRDKETAEIAVQAALTGHLVFSTLHTNDAPSALTRLVDMGVKPFLVAASIQAVMAQRLVRILCTACRRAYEPEESELRAVGLDRATVAGRPIYQPEGCRECDMTGFRGRKGVFELMELDSTLRELVFQGAPSSRIRERARLSGRMTTLLEDGVRKILGGKTTIQEILRIAHGLE
jgi:type IV pilus assembly protein PilB